MKSIGFTLLILLTFVRPNLAQGAVLKAGQIACVGELEKIDEWRQIESVIRSHPAEFGLEKDFIDLQRVKKQFLSNESHDDIFQLTPENENSGQSVYVIRLSEGNTRWFATQNKKLKAKLIVGRFPEDHEKLKELMGPVLVNEATGATYEYRDEGYLPITDKIKSMREEYNKLVISHDDHLENDEDKMTANSDFFREYGDYVLKNSEKGYFSPSVLNAGYFIASKITNAGGLRNYLFVAKGPERYSYFFSTDSKAKIFDVSFYPTRPSHFGPNEDQFNTYENRYWYDHKTFNVYFNDGRPIELENGQLLFFSPHYNQRSLQMHLSKMLAVPELKGFFIERDLAQNDDVQPTYSDFAANYLDSFITSGYVSVYAFNNLKTLSIVGKGHSAKNPKQEFLVFKFNSYTFYAYGDRVKIFGHYGWNEKDVLADGQFHEVKYAFQKRRFLIDPDNQNFNFLKNFGYELVLPNQKTLTIKHRWLSHKFKYRISG